MRITWSLCAAVLLLVGACGDDSTQVASQENQARDAMPRDGDEALEWLLEGNRRFASDQPLHAHEGIRRRAMLTEGQHPAAVVLGCADSRVPPELVFDAGLGDLFVVRVAGNVVDDDEAGSIEYAVDHLEVPLVLVMGHEGCGAVTAALGESEDEAEELSHLLASLKPALEGIDPDLPAKQRIHLGVESNVRHSVARLRKIAEREGRTQPLPPGLRIVGGVYELETGRVRMLE